MIDLSQLRSGDVIMTRVRWDWKTLPSYLSRAINFMINFWSGILTFFSKYDKRIKPRPYCPCNHVMIYVYYMNNHYIYESAGKGFVRVDAYERLKNITLDNIWYQIL